MMLLMLGLSLILHASLVGMATVEFRLKRGKQSFAPAYSVELVTLQVPEQKGRIFSTGRKTLTARAKQAIPIQRFRAKEQSLSLKKKKRAQLAGVRSEEVQPPTEVLAKIEQPSPLKPAPAPAPKTEKAVSKPPAGRKSVSLMQVGSMKGGELSQALMLYRALVNEKIESNWVLPERFSQSQDKLEAVVVVRTRRDGTVYDLHFEKKSGDPYFDDSVLKAILKSKPFPPFPDIYSPKEEEIVIHFAPENVRP
jgi:colicin import membrane protein